MDRIRVGIIGQGRSGRDIHAAHLKGDDRFEIRAVADALKDRRDRAAAELGCEAHRDYRRLLKRDDLDLVVNASYSFQHAPIAREVLRAGFHCLTEKPMAASARDADRMIAAAKESGKVLAIFQQSRFAPYFQQVRKVIDSGVLGRIVQINVAFSGFSRRWDWQTLTSYAGGALLNTGPHPLDQALRFYDSDVMPEVFCHMDRATSLGDAEDHVLLILRSPGRPLITVEVSSCNAYPCYTYNVLGTRGGLKGGTGRLDWKYYKPSEAPRQRLTRRPICKDDGTPAYCREKLTLHEESWDSPPKSEGLFQAMSKSYYDMLYRTLTQGAPLEVTPRQARQQIAVIEACQRQNPHIYGRGRKKR